MKILRLRQHLLVARRSRAEHSRTPRGYFRALTAKFRRAAQLFFLDSAAPPRGGDLQRGKKMQINRRGPRETFSVLSSLGALELSRRSLVSRERVSLRRTSVRFAVAAKNRRWRAGQRGSSGIICLLRAAARTNESMRGHLQVRPPNRI